MNFRSLVLVLGGVALATSAAAETHVVQMTTVDFEPRFVPAELTVAPGDVVEWVNVDPFFVDHALMSGTGSADPLAGELFASGTVRVNRSFEFTFDEEGDYEYFSVPFEFEGMFGVVHVTNTTDAGGDVELLSWSLVKQRFSQLLPR